MLHYDTHMEQTVFAFQKYTSSGSALTLGSS